MPYDFCTRFTAKIRRLGYPRRNAERLARFLVPRVVLISAWFDVHIVPVNTVQKLIARKGNPAAELFDERTSGCG
jgi:hypothetical protein